MPPTTLIETAATSAYLPYDSGGSGGYSSAYRNDIASMLRARSYSIWLPNGGQTSPVREDEVVAPNVETPLDAVRKRVCSEAFRAIDSLKSWDGLVTMGQIRLANSLLMSVQNTILAAPSTYAQFSTIRLATMADGELVLEWFYDKGRIQFFIDADLEDSMAVFLDGTEGNPIPRIENMAISTANIEAVASRAVELAMEYA